MKTIKLNLAKQSETNVINTLIKNEGFTKIETIYKNTLTGFVKKYKLDPDKAPLFFVKNDMFYVLQYISYIYKGKQKENLYYCPVVRANGKFKKYELA